MLFKERFRPIIYSENHTEPINLISVQIADLMFIEAGHTYSYH
jgi:hypothetical protein